MSTVIGGDVAGTTAGLNYPNGVGVDAAGNVYVGDTGHNVVRKLSPGGVTTTIAGNGGQGYSGDGGSATAAKLYYPTTVRLDGAGNIYIVDDGNNAVRMVNPAGIITTVAGLAPGASICGQATDQWGDGCPATQASLDFFDSYYGEGGTATDAAGNLYIGDTAHNLIRMVSATTGIISIFAGTGSAGYSGDGGAATSAQLNNPDGGVFDSAGNFYFSDLYNNVIRKITPGGTISTVAGTGAYGHTGDGGAATSAELGYPYQVAIDAAGDLYITDSGNFTEGDQNEVIRKVTPGGFITTVAGTVPSSTYGGDGGPATSAQMWGPVDVVVDAKGNLYIADDYNHAIRKVDVSDVPTLTFNTGEQAASAAQYVNIENLGNANLTISSIIKAGTGFSFSGNTCAVSNQTLLPGAGCIVGVEYTGAKALGPISGSVTLTDNQLNVSGSKQIVPLVGNTIAFPTTITWTPLNNDSIVYGTALSDTQLNAKAYYGSTAVAGTFVYTPAKGALPGGVGTQTLSAVFTPNLTKYSGATASVTLQVTPATPLITWARPPSVPVGTVLSGTQLDATFTASGITVPGTAVYNPPLGTPLEVVGLQTLSVTFTPNDAVDYTTATKSITMSVLK